ncbi:MAG: type II toxin-antitoxin system HipA family toxin [Prolixibacteraceae bacterium]|nr:type II toxin-antitoxin system HipA family toxin [Prolixibacteraceae bacterium]
MDKEIVVEVFYSGTRVGRLAETEQQLCAFEYDVSFLQSGFSISPFYLPLQQGVFVAKPTPFNGGFGVFDDSLPDGWGHVVLDRYLNSIGVDPYKLSILQRLALVGKTGRGALEYRPDKSIKAKAGYPDLDKLAAETEKVLKSQYDGECIDDLYRYGGSSGGARPKIFVHLDSGEWLIKFKATTDPVDVGETEFEYSKLAHKCGIYMPETQLFEDKYFGVRRFDRTNDGKVHTISAAGLVHADYRMPSLDYSTLLKVCLHLTKHMKEVYALFKLMMFNIIISNRDDHAKNFSFQYVNNQWKLAPAYDLLPSSGFNGFHTTTINGQGEPSRNDITKVAKDIGINMSKANMLMEEVIETCKQNNKLNYMPK